jgi:anaphase-promoting complex subunit 6
LQILDGFLNLVIAIEMAAKIDLTELRAQIEHLLSQHAYGCCSFLASKLATLSGYQPEDVYLLSRTYFCMDQPLRAVELIQRQGLLSRNRDNGYLNYVLLAIQCWSKALRYDEVIRTSESVLGDDVADFAAFRKRCINQWTEAKLPTVALICLERGKAYENQDNRKKFLHWLKQALHLDVRCTEALEHTLSAQLTPNEEASLMNSLINNGCFMAPHCAWLEPVFACSLRKHDCSTPSDAKFEQVETIRASAEGPTLQSDIDILAMKAESRFFQRDSRGAYELTKQVFEVDPSNNAVAAMVHIAAMVELGRTSELFFFAHRQVKEYPRKALSWYAVGAYYFSAKKFDASKRYFNKATTLDPGMMAAWIGCAHAHAMHDESDRAMAIYRTAARLFPGSHIPVIGTAMEYLRTNNVALAEQFCEQAVSLCDVDPAIYNELGVVYYRMRRFKEAAQCFDQALKRSRGLTERVLSIAFENVTFNLGHALRRAGLYDSAIQAYKLALSRCPKSSSGHASLGLTYHLSNQPDLAVECYHVALGIRPGDTIVEELMELALKDVVQRPSF